MKIIGDITSKQAAILKFLQNKISQEGRPPTLREIGRQFGFKSTGTTRDYLNSLSKKGYIRLKPRQSRAIELVRHVTFRVPILGNITAGKPDLALEEVRDYLSLDEYLSTQDRQIFALKVKGDSMIGKGIHEGDIAIVRKQQLADTGDIVAALLDNEATIKILKKKKSGFFLEAANSAYPEIHAPFTILGKVIAVIKKF